MTFLTSPSFKVRDCVGSEEHMCGCEGVGCVCVWEEGGKDGEVFEHRRA